MGAVNESDSLKAVKLTEGAVLAVEKFLATWVEKSDFVMVTKWWNSVVKYFSEHTPDAKCHMMSKEKQGSMGHMRGTENTEHGQEA